jgi:hypothetical protein
MDLWSLFRATGRLGGLVLIVASFVPLVVFSILLDVRGVAPAILFGVAVAGAMIGGLQVVMGKGGETWSFSRRPKRMTAEEIEALRSRGRPFFVCTDCRVMADGPWCPHCDGTSGVLEVRSDGDLKKVMAAMYDGPS